MHDERNLVKVSRISSVHDRFNGNVAQIRDLALEVGRKSRFASTNNDVGLNASATEFGHRVLRGLGLLLPRRTNEWHQGHVHIANVLTTDIEPELPNGFEERKDLDIAHGSADFGDDNIDRFVGQASDAALDLVSDMRNDLHGLAQVIATALCGDYG